MPIKKRQNEPVPLKALEVMQQVAKDFNISVEDMLSNCRERVYVDARHMAMLLIYEYIYRRSKPLLTVGGWFNRDHASVIHGMRKIKDLMTVDSNFRATYNNLQTVTAPIVKAVSNPGITIEDRINRLPKHDKTAILSYLEKVEKLRGIV